MANDAIPFYEDGDELTGVAVAAITGKTLVKIAGDRDANGLLQFTPAGAGDLAFGVAMYDAAAGRLVTIHTVNSGHVMPITGTGAIAANEVVKVAASGHVTAAVAGDHGVGIALTSSADGADAMISLSYIVA